MYLSRLELHGFKSFADRTVIDFSSGVTAVVGPNGCGKSNIVDAVRWVIGEQRARILRSDTMDDIIFNGSSSRRSLGMSEVLLTIENNRGVLPIEYSEVTIGRRLFRSGESEYLLNGVQCRLKDITDLFMDTGMGAGAYSVIELKMIEDILSDSADDRRHMFEEAAGISKYKIRRGQTLRKLAGTQTDLNRVRDLVDELDKRVRSLERQANKASRYKRLDDRLNHVVLALAVTEYSALSEEESSLKNLISDSGSEVMGFTTQMATLEASHETLRKEHIEKEQKVTTTQTRLVHHLDMLRQAESDLRLNQERIQSIEKDLKRAAAEQDAADVRVTGLESDLQSSDEKHARAVPAARESAARLTTARKEKETAENELAKTRTHLQSLAVEERNLQTDLAEHRRQIDRLGNRAEFFEQDLEIIAKKFKETGSSIKEIEKRRSDTEGILRSQSIENRRFLAKLEKAQSLVDAKEKELKNSEISLQKLERRVAAAYAEKTLLDSLLSSYDDLSESVQHLASSTDWSSDVLRTVADLFACDREHRIALDTALGEYASCIVVKSEDEAGRAIRNLKSNEKGRATFIISDRLAHLPLPSNGNPDPGLAPGSGPGSSSGPAPGSGPNSSSGPDPGSGPDIVEDAIPLSCLVRISDDEFQTLPFLLLHNCFLVDDLEIIASAIPATGRYFTVEGEWYDAAGYHHGGSPATGTSVAASRMGRREHFDRVKVDILALEAEIKTTRKQIDEARTALENIPLNKLESALAKSLEKAGVLESRLGQTDYELSALARRTRELEDRSSEIRKQRGEASTQIESLQSELDRMDEVLTDVRTRRHGSEITIETLEESNRLAFSQFNEINIAAVEARNELEHLTQEITRFRVDIERLNAETKRRREMTVALDKQLSETKENSASLEVELDKLRKNRNKLDQEASDSKDVLSEVKVGVSDIEAELRTVRREREEAMSGETRHSVRQAEIKTRLADLIGTMAEDYEIDIAGFSVEIDEGFEVESARTEIRDLRIRIRNLGPVNALALDSFDDEKKRLDFLQEQLTDLEKAENTLLTTIKEINETASARFNETFSAIRSNFVKLFVELFGDEASADVVLVNPDDPLESPIEVMARPEGKKLSVLAQLSGGEKTLTAIALLFAIYLVKPSPFCILDEVDAPLDDANVDRFMHMIRTFSESTQFILVTHNKRTMEAADCMYGVTMAEQGVSKLVGVKFESQLELVA